MVRGGFFLLTYKLQIGKFGRSFRQLVKMYAFAYLFDSALDMGRACIKKRSYLLGRTLGKYHQRQHYSLLRFTLRERVDKLGALVIVAIDIDTYHIAKILAVTIPPNGVAALTGLPQVLVYQIGKGLFSRER